MLTITELANISVTVGPCEDALTNTDAFLKLTLVSVASAHHVNTTTAHLLIDLNTRQQQAQAGTDPGSSELSSIC
jgi:hypothetical protein